MKRKAFAAALACCLAGMPAFAQLTVDACREKARANYPLSRKYGLIDRAASYSIAALYTGYLPQVSISGKRTNQSDINPMSGIPKDQYQLGLEVSQTLWDGGLIWTQGRLRSAEARADRAQVDVDLYALDRRIDQLFFSVLLITARLDQNAILQAELATNAGRVAAYVANGVAVKADADQIEVERIQARQDRIALEAQLRSYTAMLSGLIGEDLAPGTTFVRPAETAPEAGGTDAASADAAPAIVSRPELALFDARRDLVLKRRGVAIAADSPRLSAFFQGLYGDPSLDSSESGAGRDWIAGLRFSWNLGSAYSLPGTLLEIDADRKLLEADREAFLVNADLDVRAAADEVAKIRDLIAGDQEIIALRTRIKKAAEVRVANGTLSVPDLLREIDAENLAVQAKLVHEIQLQMAIRELKTLVKG